MSIEKQFRSFAPAAPKSQMGRTKNAVIYTRVSSKEQAENASLDTQLKYCNDFAKRKGFEVQAYFGGTYESAKSDERKEFKRMLEYVRKNKSISYILVYAYDRFSRTGANGAYISSELKKRGIGTLSVTQEVDPTTPAGVFQEGMYHIFSQMDNQTRMERCQNGMVEKLRQGYWPMSPPLGFTNLNKGQRADLHKIVVNDQGKQLRKAWMWKMKHNMPNKDIVAKLQKTGLKICERKLSKIFRNPFYCGVIVCKFIPGEVVQGKHEPLVPPADFKKVYELLTNAVGYKSSHSVGIQDGLPLRVFMKCGECDSPYTGYYKKDKNLYYYKCRQNGCKQNRSQKVVHADFEKLLTRFQIPERSHDNLKQMMLYTIQQCNREAVEQVKLHQKELIKIEQRMEQLEERFVFGEIEKPLYEKYNKKFEQERVQISAELEQNEISSSNLENCVNYVVDISQNLSNMWASGDYQAQVKLQNLLFPDGINYDREVGAFRTSRVNLLFAAIPELTVVWSNKKTGSEESISFDPVKWRRRDSNPRPNKELLSFLHVYPSIGCRLKAGQRQPTNSLASSISP